MCDSPEVPVSSDFEVVAAEPLREPLLILGYAGWSDAGESATTALRYLVETFSATLHARIDTEEYLDFTEVRPEAKLSDEGTRRIVWPDHRFHAARIGGEEHGDLLIGIGDEPHLRWKRYARSLVELAQHMGVRRVILIGAYLADVIYSQPTRVSITSTDPEWRERFHATSGRYEGPIGILSVLADALQQAEIPQATLWAQIPHYISAQPHLRGSLALLQRVEELAGVRFDLARMQQMAGEFDSAVSEMISGDPELSAYVRELKRRAFSQ